MRKKIVVVLIVFSVQFFCVGAVLANSKILATSGAMQIEGAAGGGIVPWAVIGGYGSDDEQGGAAALTQIYIDDFHLDTMSVLYGVNNRFEISLSEQTLRVEPLNLDIEQQILGVKVRLFGDIIYNKMPQLSVGLQYKKNQDNFIPFALGARDDSDIDVYFSASKLKLDSFFGRNLLLSGTLRRTQANQTGLLGFGRQNNSQYDWVVEGSAALLINRHWAAGFEYRQKPDRLSAVQEDDWKDLFVAWFPNKTVSVVLAYSELGDIAGLLDQQGWYFSVQISQ